MTKIQFRSNMSNILSSSPVTIIVVIITIITIIKNEQVAAVRSCRRATESSAHLLLGFRPARPFSSSLCRFCQKIPTLLPPSSPLFTIIIIHCTMVIILLFSISSGLSLAFHFSPPFLSRVIFWIYFLRS